jgi:hypothetical protein
VELARWFGPRLAASLLCAAASSGCTLIFPTGDPQCATDADCTARGAAFADAVCKDEVCVAGGPDPTEPWSCLGQVEWPAAGTSPLRLEVHVIDVLTSAPPEGLAVRVCAKLDVNCDSPIAAPASLDASGAVVAQVSAGFDGYLELTAPTITPALFFVTQPVYADTVVPGVVPVVSPAGFQSIAAALGTTLDLTVAGHVYALASDCAQAPASGVRFDLDKKGVATTPFYMVNNAPVGSASATDGAGAGGYLNVPPGFVKLTGSVSATGARVGESSLVVRAGTVSYPRLIPTP